MTNQQLYLAIGIPSCIAALGILVNIGYFLVLNNRMTAMETKTSAMGETVAGLKVLMDIVLKKLDELEARVERKP